MKQQFVHRKQPVYSHGYILYRRLLDPADLFGTPAPPVRRNGVGNGASSSLLLLSCMVNLRE
jgi:hypothetical protein